MISDCKVVPSTWAVLFPEYFTPSCHCLPQKPESGQDGILTRIPQPRERRLREPFITCSRSHSLKATGLGLKPKVSNFSILHSSFEYFFKSIQDFLLASSTQYAVAAWVLAKRHTQVLLLSWGLPQKDVSYAAILTRKADPHKSDVNLSVYTHSKSEVLSQVLSCSPPPGEKPRKSETLT